MRLLAEENFPRPLRRNGHDVVWARTDLPGWKDTALLDHAEAESRLVLTLDTDFWQIALQRRQPLEQAGVILFRVHPATPASIEPLVRAVLDAGQHWASHVSGQFGRDSDAAIQAYLMFTVHAA